MNYKKILEDISNRIGGEETCEYKVLVHRTHKRVIAYKHNPLALEFIKPKFRHSFFKKAMFFLIKHGISPLEKKIQLSSRLGDVIYIANQVKSFDLLNEEVIVFEKGPSSLEANILLQKKLAEEELAPKILDVNKESCYYKEELLYDGDIPFTKILFKLRYFYKLSNFKYIHGDLCLDHIKKNKEGEVRFIDWNIKEGSPKEELNNFLGSLK